MWTLILKLAVEGLGSQESFNEGILALKSNLEPHLKQLRQQENVPPASQPGILYPYDAGSDGNGEDSDSAVEAEMNQKEPENPDRGDTQLTRLTKGPSTQGTKAPTSAPKDVVVSKGPEETKRCSQRLVDKTGSGLTTPAHKDKDSNKSGGGVPTWKSRSTKVSKGKKPGQVIGKATAKGRAGMGYRKKGTQGSSSEPEEEAEELSGSEAEGSNTDGERFELLSEGESGLSRISTIAQRIHDLEKTSPKRFGDIMNNTKLPVKKRVRLLAQALGEPARKRAKMEAKDDDDTPDVPEVNVSEFCLPSNNSANPHEQILKSLKDRGFETVPGHDNTEIPLKFVLPLPFVGPDNIPTYYNIVVNARNHPRLVSAETMVAGSLDLTFLLFLRRREEATTAE